MLSLLVALTFPMIQDKVVNLGTVDIGGRQVAITFPVAKGPFDENSPHVEIGGYKYIVGADQNLHERYLIDGGGGEVTTKYPALASKVASASEYRIKVFLLSTGEILEERTDGRFIRRRGFLSTTDIDNIYGYLARFKAMAEVASEGAIRVTFDVTTDDDLVFRHVKEGGKDSKLFPIDTTILADSKPADDSVLGSQFIHDEIAPTINNGKFESEIQRYHGPFSSVFVFHSVPTEDWRTFLLDRTPVTTISWPNFMESYPDGDPSFSLFQSFQEHLLISASASGRTVSSSFASYGQAIQPPMLFGRFPLISSFVAFGNHFSTSYAVREESIGYGSELLHGGSMPLIGSRRVWRKSNVEIAVDSFLADQFAKQHPTAEKTGRITHTNDGWDWIVFTASNVKFDNDLEALGLLSSVIPTGVVAQRADLINIRQGVDKTVRSNLLKQEIEWFQLLKSPLTPDDVAKIRVILAGSDIDLRLNALGALGRVDTEELTTDVGISAMSASASESYLAIAALKKRKDNGAWSQIASTALRGPFGHNYRFAAEALRERPEDFTVDLLSSPMFDRSWHSRRAAALTLNMIDTPKADLLAPFILDDPDPRVRITAAMGPRIKKKSFANRLAWSAVNDESEWVRIACSLALLSSDDAEIRKQAYSAVRDEGESVRLAVLRAMTATPREEYRQSLRAAIVDRSAAVRAQTLRAFATQPGVVLSEEVQNTFSDPSPLVKAALLDLANAKGIKLP